MESKVGEESKGKSPLATVMIIVSVLLGIVLTTVIHYKILTDNSPGYAFGKFIINFFWMDILIGLGVGFGIFIALIILIIHILSLKEESTSS